MIANHSAAPASSLSKANILIDGAGRARLTDFGLLTLFVDPASTLSSSSGAQDGLVRWMSPELIYPEKFGPGGESLPTEYSDCYSLGMVVYETISETPPFHRDSDYTILLKVARGEHPPRKGEFANSLWEMLKSCWKFQPVNRPSIKDVLRCLEEVSNPSGAPPLLDSETEGGDGWDLPGGSFDAEKWRER